MATVADNLNRIKTAKASIKASIEAKGVAVPADALIDTYASKIDEIPTGGGKPKLVKLWCDKNGNYKPFANTDGFNEVEVNVPAPEPVKEPAIYNPADVELFKELGYEHPLGYAPLLDPLDPSYPPTYDDYIASMKKGVDYGSEIKRLWNRNTTSMQNMYADNTEMVYFPVVDTSSVTNMQGAFSRSKLAVFPVVDTYRVTNMESAFFYCFYLTTLPKLITSNVTNVNKLFCGCLSLKSIPEMDFGKVETINNFFIDEQGPEGWENIGLTDLGGFTGLKIDWNDNYGLAICPNLTKQSVLNVLNGLYDFRGNGDASTTKTIKFHPNSIALLTDEEKAIATNKGWVLA